METLSSQERTIFSEHLPLSMCKRPGVVVWNHKTVHHLLEYNGFSQIMIGGIGR